VGAQQRVDCGGFPAPSAGQEKFVVWLCDRRRLVSLRKPT